MNPARYTIFADLQPAFDAMRQHLVAAHVARGIVVADDNEFKDTCEEAIGCVVSYILSYVRTRQRPSLSHETSAMMRLAERLSDVFPSVGEAAIALHDVETFALEAVTDVLPEHNNFDIHDWQVRLYTLVIFVEDKPPGMLQYEVPKPLAKSIDLSQPVFTYLDKLPIVATVQRNDPVSPYSKFYPESSWPKNEKDPQQFGEGFVIYMPGPADPPPSVQAVWVDDTKAYPTQPKKVAPDDDDNTMDNVSF